MLNVLNLFRVLDLIINPSFVLIVFLIACSIEVAILYRLIKKKSISKDNSPSLIFLIGVLLCSILTNSEWILTLVIEIFGSHLIPPSHFVFLRRLAWAGTIGQYQFLSLFLESIITNKYVNLRQTILSAISSLCALFFIGIACIDYTCSNTVNKPQIEFTAQAFTLCYLLYFLMPLSIGMVYRTLKHSHLPLILNKQVRILLSAVIIPFWCSDAIQSISFFISAGVWKNNLYTLVTLSTILLSYALYYATRKMVGLRFLNLSDHVESQYKRKTNLDNFKLTLEQLNMVTDHRELYHITKRFFKTVFDIEPRATRLYLRSKHSSSSEKTLPRIQKEIEDFLAEHTGSFAEEKIFIYDEIEFSHFYSHSVNEKIILELLDKIHADILIPIYFRQKIIAYIVVLQHSRPLGLYSRIERDEMVVFASYLANIINLLEEHKTQNINRENTGLKNQVTALTHKNNLYHESLQYLLHNHLNGNIGLILYKNNHFMYLNEHARKLVPIDLNIHAGNRFAQEIRMLTQQTLMYKATQQKLLRNDNNESISIKSFAYPTHNAILLLVHTLNMEQIINQHAQHLDIPLDWPYMLALETTTAGKTIQHFLPGYAKTLSNIKVSLIKSFFSQDCILLDMHTDDLQPMINLLHQISKYESLITINGKELHKNPHLLNLLTHESNISTTFHISNLEQIPESIQAKIALMLTDFHSSNHRFLCSTSAGLLKLTYQTRIHNALKEILFKHTISLTPPPKLPHDDYISLVRALTHKAIPNSALTHVCMFDEKEIKKYFTTRPESLTQLKEKIHRLMQKKISLHTHDQENNNESTIDDPHLIHAAQLGKHALKNKDIMNYLWNKFKNQTKIATFLGVNRSSVNRRCKQYGIK